MDIDLNLLLADVQPNILTPHLSTITSVKNDKKAKTISQILVKHFHSRLENPVPKQIIHKGEIHTIRYFDIEPLLVGAWSEISLILLNLSYAEQCDIIDAIYPEAVKLTAKAFAINFTRDTTDIPIVPVRDDDIHKELSSQTIGIAMILATLGSMGGRPNIHPDVISRYVKSMSLLSSDQSDRDKYMANMERSQQAAKYQDTLRK